MAAVGTAVFRFDAGRQLGGGHAIRCLGLADALIETGVRCAFAITGATLETLPNLAKKGIEIFTVRENGSAGEIPQASFGPADWLIVDHPDWTAPEIARTGPLGEKIAVVSDAAEKQLDCDAVIDSAADLQRDAYADFVPAGCAFLSGPGYALLRPPFAALRRQSIDTKKKATGKAAHVPGVFIGFGATDPHDATTTALDALASVRNPGQVTVALGSSAPGLSAVEKRAAASNGAVRLFVDADNIAELMADADFAIGGAGITSWERCSLGLPAIVIPQADNQLPNADVLARHGAALVLEDRHLADAGRIATAVSTLRDDRNSRAGMIDCAAALCDGLGARRVAQYLFPEISKDGQPVRLRPATPDDSDIMYRWQTHPDMRRYFRTPEPPTRREHEEWLAAKLADPGCLFNIVECAGEAAGVLRLDNIPGCATPDAREVSILVAPEHHRRGIGAAALELGRRLQPYAGLHASVHAANAASRRLFAEAGYRHSGGDAYILEPGLRVGANA